MPRRSVPRWMLPALVAVIALGVAVLFLLPRSPATQTAWARFDTQDVHSLAFVAGDVDRLLFGHHGGLFESRDGGRSWSPLPLRDDAMSMAPAGDGSIVIAGHLVLRASRDGGATWAPIPSDLPNLDIHGFTRDPSNPARMWAYLATGGLWTSNDFGAHFIRVREDNVVHPVAVAGPTGTRLFGLDATGLVASDDGGLTWSTIATPEFGPVTSLVATQDGSVLYAGTPDGLYRSDDGGRGWLRTAYEGSAFAVATTQDGRTVAVVSRETSFFRSPDGGASWPGP